MGFGHFSFIYNEKEIEEIVVRALSRTQLDYLILHKAVLFDESGEKIQGALDMQAQPIREGSFVDLTSLLPPGVLASSFTAEVLDPNNLTVTKYQGLVKATQSRSLAA